MTCRRSANGVWILSSLEPQWRVGANQHRLWQASPRFSRTNEQPSLVMVDSQSVEMAQKGDRNMALMAARSVIAAQTPYCSGRIGLDVVLFCQYS